MRLHLCRPAADHLFTEEGEPQPVSSCRADGRGSRSLARRLFFLLFFRCSRAAGGAIRPHRPQNPQALDFSSAVADTRGAAHPPPAPPSPQRKHRPKAGPAEPPAGPAHVWLGLDFPTSRPLTRGVPPPRTRYGWAGGIGITHAGLTRSVAVSSARASRRPREVARRLRRTSSGLASASRRALFSQSSSRPCCFCWATSHRTTLLLRHSTSTSRVRPA
jgi:hypothetical protein